MILFLNFAPIEFMGGAERWMAETAKEIAKIEETVLISVSPSLANIYSRLVLKRTFENRVSKNNHKLPPHISLRFVHFVPFTPQWRKARETIKQARLIYARWELSELIILLYFGGFSVLNKTIAGIHSPLVYKKTISFFDRLHKILYESFLWRMVLSRVNKVHAVSPNDANFVKNIFRLQNAIHIPNGLEIPPFQSIKNTKGKNVLKILFVGDLSFRKGIDVVLHAIRKAPQHFMFSIVGDGEKKERVCSTIISHENATYHGYCSKETLNGLYETHDVFFLPSRAEGMSLSLLEGLAFGLVVVDSPDIRLGLPTKIEYTPTKNTAEKYLQIFESLLKKKIAGQLHKEKIHKYAKDHYDKHMIITRYQKELFNISD